MGTKVIVANLNSLTPYIRARLMTRERKQLCCWKGKQEALESTLVQGLLQSHRVQHGNVSRCFRAQLVFLQRFLRTEEDRAFAGECELRGCVPAASQEEHKPSCNECLHLGNNYVSSLGHPLPAAPCSSHWEKPLFQWLLFRENRLVKVVFVWNLQLSFPAWQIFNTLLKTNNNFQCCVYLDSKRPRYKFSFFVSCDFGHMT